MPGQLADGYKFTFFRQTRSGLSTKKLNFYPNRAYSLKIATNCATRPANLSERRCKQQTGRHAAPAARRKAAAPAARCPATAAGILNGSAPPLPTDPTPQPPGRKRESMKPQASGGLQLHPPRLRLRLSSAPVRPPFAPIRHRHAPVRTPLAAIYHRHAAVRPPFTAVRPPFAAIRHHRAAVHHRFPPVRHSAEPSRLHAARPAYPPFVTTATAKTGKKRRTKPKSVQMFS